MRKKHPAFFYFKILFFYLNFQYRFFVFHRVPAIFFRNSLGGTPARRRNSAEK